MDSIATALPQQKLCTHGHTTPTCQLQNYYNPTTYTFAWILSKKTKSLSITLSKLAVEITYVPEVVHSDTYK